MKKSTLDKSIERVLQIKMEAVNYLISDLIEPLEVNDNPEELLGKHFAQWTPQDLELLKKVYGTAEPNVLSNFIFKKTYERVKTLESEEL